MIAHNSPSLPVQLLDCHRHISANSRADAKKEDTAIRRWHAESPFPSAKTFISSMRSRTSLEPLMESCSIGLSARNRPSPWPSS